MCLLTQVNKEIERGEVSVFENLIAEQQALNPAPLEDEIIVAEPEFVEPDKPLVTLVCEMFECVFKAMMIHAQSLFLQEYANGLKLKSYRLLRGFPRAALAIERLYSCQETQQMSRTKVLALVSSLQCNATLLILR